jgi:ABC-type multidrug transport system ATPase subunit
MALVWNNVSYQIPAKLVLDNLSGTLEVGDFLAILGPSGSGKTSLLNVLAGRVRSGGGVDLHGEVIIRGHSISSSRSSQLIGYVTQEDHLFAHLTVRETLLLAAKFHLPISTSEADIESKVQSVVQELGLVSSLDSMVGSSSRRGISGGEKKRLSIGKELMSSPSYVFIDEPTTGSTYYIVVLLSTSNCLYCGS